jgi:hypothetical protein
MPVFDMIETVLVMKFRFRPSLMLRLIARSVYVGNALYTLLTELRSLSSEGLFMDQSGNAYKTDEI